MSEAVIKLENVSKYYKLYKAPGDRFKEALNPFGRIYHSDFYALKNINLDIKRGEILGIVGRNGSGKSTLLKLICGVLEANNGRVMVKGNISALLELGSGFNPEFTGIQNIYFYGAIMGFSRAQMTEKLDEILAFADIGDFINQPLKSYSSGMRSRLGFAVAINIEPEILILDEVLSVGDDYFKRKCYVKMKEFFEAGKTILFVSHALQSVNEFCTKCILIDSGEVIMEGPPDIVTKMHSKLLFADKQDYNAVRHEIKHISDKESEIDVYVSNETNKVIDTEEVAELDDNLKSKTAQFFGPCDIEFKQISILDDNGDMVNCLLSGRDYLICYSVKINEDVVADSLNFGVGIGSEKNVFITGMHSNNIEASGGTFTKGRTIDCSLKFRCLLLTGNYYLSFSCLNVCGPEKILLRKLVDGYMFNVRHNDYEKTGLVQLFLSHDANFV